MAARLFERSRAGAVLTDAGKRFRDGVAAGLSAIHRAADEAAELAGDEQVVIACSHEASHFLIMPRYGRDDRAIGARPIRTGGAYREHEFLSSSPPGGARTRVFHTVQLSPMAEDDGLRLRRIAGWIREELDRDPGLAADCRTAPGTRAQPRSRTANRLNATASRPTAAR